MVKRRCKEKRIICENNVEQSKTEVTTTAQGGKTKTKVNKNSQFGGSGSGRTKGAKSYNLPKKRERLRDIRGLENEVLQSIIGQDKPVRQIIAAIYKAASFSSLKSNILIIGNSGTGKTATIEQIAKKMHLPYTIEDATKYT